MLTWLLLFFLFVLELGWKCIADGMETDDDKVKWAPFYVQYSTI